MVNQMKIEETEKITAILKVLQVPVSTLTMKFLILFKTKVNHFVVTEGDSEVVVMLHFGDAESTQVLHSHLVVE